MSLRKNGDVVIDGRVYSTPGTLKVRLIELKSRNSDCIMNMKSERGTEFKTEEHFAAVMRELHIPWIGFLTEPDNH
jgi:hypothetical protein